MFAMILAIVFAIIGLIIVLAARKKAVGVIALLLAALFMFLACTVTLDTGYTGIVTTFGKVENVTLSEGLNVIKPWQDVVKMNNQKQKTSFSFNAFSGDIQQTLVTGSVNHSINPATAMNLYRDVGVKYLDTLVAPRLQECTKSVFSAYTAEELISRRDQLSVQITEKMQQELEGYGINIIDVVVEDIDFTDAFTSAVEAKQVATQEKLRAQTEQEQQTMAAKAEAERKKIAAESEAAVKKTNAEADAYATTVKAEAEAEANRKIAESLTDEIIQYSYANAWDGVLPSTFVGSDETIPVINAVGAVGMEAE